VRNFFKMKFQNENIPFQEEEEEEEEEGNPKKANR
jgi:hypothetical protein